MNVETSHLKTPRTEEKLSEWKLTAETQVEKSKIEISQQTYLSPARADCKIITTELEIKSEETKRFKEELEKARTLAMSFNSTGSLKEFFKIQRLNKSLKSIRVKKKRTYYWKIFELASLYLVRLKLYCFKRNFLLCCIFHLIHQKFLFCVIILDLQYFLKNLVMFIQFLNFLKKI